MRPGSAQMLIKQVCERTVRLLLVRALRFCISSCEQRHPARCSFFLGGCLHFRFPCGPCVKRAIDPSRARCGRNFTNGK